MSCGTREERKAKCRLGAHTWEGGLPDLGLRRAQMVAGWQRGETWRAARLVGPRARVRAGRRCDSRLCRGAAGACTVGPGTAGGEASWLRAWALLAALHAVRSSERLR